MKKMVILVVFVIAIVVGLVYNDYSNKWIADNNIIESYIVIDGLVDEQIINANGLSTEDRRAIIDSENYGVFITSGGITELRDHNGEGQFSGLHQVKIGDKAYAFGKVFVCEKICTHNVDTTTWTSDANPMDFAYYDLLIETCASADGSVQLHTYWKIVNY